MSGGIETNWREPAAAPLAELESTLSRIPTVTAARVVADLEGKVTEVHLLATPERAPKQLVRDAQSAALASHGVTLDYRTVSVVQLDDPIQPGLAPTAGGARPMLQNLETKIRGHVAEVEVVLALTEETFTGRARGPADAVVRLAVEATAQALESKLRERTVTLESAEFVSAGRFEVAVVVLRVTDQTADLAVSGSALVRTDRADACARATLAGINRLIAYL